MNRIYPLALLHFVAAVCACAYSESEGMIDGPLEYLPLVPHLAIMLAQACLLAIWAVMGSNSLMIRGLGTIVGLAYLELVCRIGTNEDDFVWLASLSVASVAVVLLVSRRWIAPLRKMTHRDANESASAFQFSIRALMLMTFAVALGIVLAQMLHKWLGNPTNLMELAMWVAAISITGLCSVWATLTRANPMPRSIVVVIFAALSAAIVAWGFQEGWEAYFYLITITLLQAIIVLGSLFVVRMEGYRLMRRKSAPPPAT